MKKTRKHFCDTCREITEHIIIKEKREIACVNYKYHPSIKWCEVCGGRTDNFECKGHK